MNEQDIVKIKILNTQYWIQGERRADNKWDLFMVQPGSSYKSLVKKGITTNAFAIFSNMTLKTPFPNK
ncbi:MAG: hypothetical protein WC735_00640 [Candidatus Paceibacterota bacterium]|jgi:hypothetical protein